MYPFREQMEHVIHRCIISDAIWFSVHAPLILLIRVPRNSLSTVTLNIRLTATTEMIKILMSQLNSL